LANNPKKIVTEAINNTIDNVILKVSIRFLILKYFFSIELIIFYSQKWFLKKLGAIIYEP